MWFLFRIVGGLVAAGIAGFGVLLVGALILQGARDPEGGGVWALTLAFLVTCAVAFVWMFRRLGRGKWEERRVAHRIRKLEEQGVRRNLAPRAWEVASVLGGGTYAAPTLRIQGGQSLAVESLEGGTWRAVFAAQWHPEVAGQMVPGTLRKDPALQDTYNVSARRVGHRPARWEVQAYIPGRWEDELERLWQAAQQAEKDRERQRFGV